MPRMPVSFGCALCTLRFCSFSLLSFSFFLSLFPHLFAPFSLSYYISASFSCKFGTPICLISITEYCQKRKRKRKIIEIYGPSFRLICILCVISYCNHIFLYFVHSLCTRVCFRVFFFLFVRTITRLGRLQLIVI